MTKTTTPAAAPAASTPTASAPKTTKPKVAPVIASGAPLALALPERNVTRGSSPYPFDSLGAPVRDSEGKITAAFSFGVTNKTARELAQVVSNANKRYRKGEGETATQERHFFAIDVDPATDPAGAKARVFRDQ